jgi:tRNA G18 (ribose-2'-O)-methylase SpoU
VASLRERGVHVVALEQTPGSVPFDEFDYAYPLCFVVGHEVDGVSAPVLELADATVEIAMAGAKKSLNVAVGFGLMAYEIRRRWLRGREAGA